MPRRLRSLSASILFYILNCFVPRVCTKDASASRIRRVDCHFLVGCAVYPRQFCCLKGCFDHSNPHPSSVVMPRRLRIISVKLLAQKLFCTQQPASGELTVMP